MQIGYNLSKNTLILAIAATTVFFLLGQVGAFTDLYVVSSLLVAKLQGDSHAYFAGLESDLQFFQDLKTIRDENLELKQANSSLFAENEALKLQIADMQTITKQLQFDLPYDLEPARVLKYDENDHSLVYLNKGSNSEIAVGDVVIIETYLLGEVVEVNSNFSVAMLITSPEILVPAISIENGSKGIVSGSSRSVQITDILTAERLDQSDTIITSGQDGKYPYGLIIGTVTKINRIESELTKSAEIETQYAVDRLFDVFIIKNED